MFLLLGCLSDTVAGAPHPLHVFHVASQDLPGHHAVSDGADQVQGRAVISAYVYDHPQGRVLIDAAYGRATAQNPADYPGRLFMSGTGNFEMGAPVVDQLDQAPDLIVVTHLHADHAGGLADFPDVPLLIDPNEWEAGLTRPITQGYVKSAYQDRTNTRDLVFDSGPVGPFEATHDLFGDGRLVLISAPGHTAGSTLVLVDQRILLTGDTAWIDANWQGPKAKGKTIRNHVEFDWQQQMQHQWRIKQWAEEDPSRRVIAGHDPSNADLPATL